MFCINKKQYYKKCDIIKNYRLDNKYKLVYSYGRIQLYILLSQPIKNNPKKSYLRHITKIAFNNEFAILV